MNQETGLNKLAGPELIRAISANPPKKWYRLARLRNPSSGDNADHLDTCGSD
jgi:hypothetical protein